LNGSLIEPGPNAARSKTIMTREKPGGLAQHVARVDPAACSSSVFHPAVYSLTNHKSQD